MQILSGREARAEFLRAMRSGSAARPATFDQAAAAYIAAGGERKFVDRLVKHFASTPLVEIDQAAIDRAAQDLYPSASPATRARQVHTPASAILKCAGIRWRIARPPQPKRTGLHWLTPGEGAAMLRTAAAHFRPLLRFMLLTGACSIAESVYLDWRQIDLERSQVRFKRDQGVDTVPLRPSVVADLSSLPNRHGAVFRGPDGFPYFKTARAASAIKTVFGSARRDAQLHGITTRDLRVTAAVWQLALHVHLDRAHRIELLVSTSGWRDLRTIAPFERIPPWTLSELREALGSEELDG